MQSDALSAAQLAEIQQRIEETLKAQGINPSVFSELVGVAPRPRRPPPHRVNDGGKGNHRREKPGKKDKPKGQKEVKLSILES